MIENLEGEPLFVNPAFCTFLGFTEEELHRKHCVDFSPVEDAAKDWELFQCLRAGSINHYQLEKRYFRRDGSLVWGSLSISLFRSQPSPLVIAMVEDITAKKVAEELIVAGIPESEHSVESLRARIPGDFSGESFEGLSPDMTAELLLYFITKGIVTLPIAADTALLDMPWGSHVCQFYNRKEDLVKLLVPYFKQGLEKNEACVWLVGDLTVEETRDALAAVVPDLEHYISTGQMQIRHYTELYTNPNGTVKPADQLSDEFAEMGSTVRSKGFAGLRASGSVSWVNDEESMSRFMDYETKVNCAIQDSRMMAVCTYPARAAALHGSRELIHNHGNIYVKRGEWVYDNSRDAKKIEAVFASLAGL